MAETYKLPKITLTEDAKEMMLRYKWPGNVRQLKNITEQMSVLSREREINAEVLKHFIPEDQESTQLAPISSNGNHSYESEREILYKILYELRGNVSDLRRDMANLRRQLDDVSTIRADELPSVTSHIAPSGVSTAALNNHIPAINGARQTSKETFVEAEAEEIDDIENLNLSELGRQLVEKALERNGGNRKKAAAELGISDRTLYRRIKQYGLEGGK